jgi:hypothetical protein
VDRPERGARQRQRRLGDGAGDAEVGDLDLPVATDQHVPGLHVAVDDPLRVGRGSARATAAVMRAACRGGSGPLARRIVARSSPSTSSMTMNGPFGSSP